MQQPANFVGKVFRRSDQGALWRPAPASCRNVNLPDRYPDIIVQASNEKDVVAAVRLANANTWTIGARSGGHSWSCNHVRDGGMLLDVSRLNAVTIDAAEMRAMVGPGCRGNQVNRSVGGAEAVLPDRPLRGRRPRRLSAARRLRLALARGGNGLRERAGASTMSAPTANCATRAPSENAEMYWAARGAGPGFFGVITRFHLKLYRRPKVIGAKLAFYTADHFEEIVRWGRVRFGRRCRLDRADVHGSALHSRSSTARIMVVAPVFADSIFRGVERPVYENAAARREARTPFIPMRLSTLTARVMRITDNHRYAVDTWTWARASPDALLPASQAHRRQAAAGAVAYSVDELGAEAAAARHGVFVRG